jgi:hypothetical protein
VQEFANADNDHASIVLGAVVVFEVTRFDDSGDQTYRITYTIPSDQTSMAAAIGLLDAGLHMVREDALTGDGDDE